MWWVPFPGLESGKASRRSGIKLNLGHLLAEGGSGVGMGSLAPGVCLFMEERECSGGMAPST